MLGVAVYHARPNLRGALGVIGLPGATFVIGCLLFCLGFQLGIRDWGFGLVFNFGAYARHLVNVVVKLQHAHETIRIRTFTLLSCLRWLSQN